MSTARSWTRPRLSPRLIVRVVVVAVAAVVLYEIGASTLEGQPGGTSRPGSSFATGESGTAALAMLLERNGYEVDRRREPLTTAALDPSTTLFVLEPSADFRNTWLALRDFVWSGGRLVIGGTSVSPALETIGDDPPRWDAWGRSSWNGVDPTLAPVGEITSDGLGSWGEPGGSRTLVGDDERALLTVEPVGDGEILYLADISPLSNDGLASADNAAFALWLAGDAPRPVAFDEHVHGYDTGAGLGAIPDRWKSALLRLALAAAAFMWARGVRLGPPEERARPLPPPRRMHVDALATTLARVKPVHAVAEPVQAAARSRVAARGCLPPDAPYEQLARVAATAGLDGDEVRAVLGPVTDDDGVVAAGRALARLHAAPGTRYPLRNETATETAVENRRETR